MNRDEFYKNLYLAHHGIEGQKWGKRNGPPYPLTPEEHAKVIRDGDIKTLKDNMSEFKDFEIEATLKRFDYNKKLSQLTHEDPPKTPKQLKDEAFLERCNTIAKKAGAFGNAAQNTANAAENSIRVYNAVAKTFNSLFGKDWKIIETNNQNKDKKKDKGNNNNSNSGNKEKPKSFLNWLTSDNSPKKDSADFNKMMRESNKQFNQRLKQQMKQEVQREKIFNMNNANYERYVFDLKQKYGSHWRDYMYK